MVWWRRIHTCCLCHRPWYVQLEISFMTTGCLSTLWQSPWETVSFVSLRSSEVCKAKVYEMLKVKVKQNLLFFFGASHLKLFCYTYQLKNRTNCGNWLLAWSDADWNTNLWCAQFQGARPDYMQVESSSCCFPMELVSFVYRTKSSPSNWM